MTNFKTAALLAALVCGTAGVQAASILDTFSDGAMLVQSGTLPYAEACTASADAPGGRRWIAAAVAQAGKFTFSAVQAGPTSPWSQLARRHRLQILTTDNDFRSSSLHIEFRLWGPTDG